MEYSEFKRMLGEVSVTVRRRMARVCGPDMADDATNGAVVMLLQPEKARCGPKEHDLRDGMRRCQTKAEVELLLEAAARHVAYRYRRGDQRRSHQHALAARFMQQDNPAKGEAATLVLQRDVRDALSHLAPRTREVAWRVLALGECLREVARDLGLRHSTVQYHLDMAIPQLQRLLRQYDTEGLFSGVRTLARRYANRTPRP